MLFIINNSVFFLAKNHLNTDLNCVAHFKKYINLIVVYSTSLKVKKQLRIEYEAS